ncbi:MAG TPA: 4-hydroxybenzoate octaprenyltransferase [Steroidobacteraceae bacterium]|nr:4-hydroxybenzoate octaprenyltransferase [Steroidobacteraceae bacterium]
MPALYQHIQLRAQNVIQRIGNSRFATQSLPPMLTTIRNYAELMRLHKPIGIFLLMWPTLWALWLASHGRPNEQVFVVFILGVILTRSAGCVINDYADREFDARVARTKDRPIADKRIEPTEALFVFAGLSFLALALVLTQDRFTQLLALPGAAMIVTYPFFKRFFPLPQAYLGAAFSWSIPMAFAAQTGNVPVVAWLLFIANVLWTTAYDTMYAMADREDDLKIGIRSSAILFGDADRAMIGLMQFMTLLALALVGVNMQLGFWYYLGIVGATFFAIYQQVLIYDRASQTCLRAFLNNNYFGMCVFGGMALSFLFS